MSQSLGGLPLKYFRVNWNYSLGSKTLTYTLRTDLIQVTEPGLSIDHVIESEEGIIVLGLR